MISWKTYNSLPVSEFIKKVALNNEIINKKYINKHFNAVYTIDDFLDTLMYFIKTGVSIRNIRGSMSASAFYAHHSLFIKLGIYKKAFDILLKYYKKLLPQNSFAIDSSFIVNKNSSFADFNKYYSSKKKCVKISLITDLNGIPVNVKISKGSMSDICLFFKHNSFFNNNVINTFIADKGYNSSSIRDSLQSHNILVLIPKQKRNGHNFIETKLSNEHKNIYAKRINIEHTFSKIKKFRYFNELHTVKITNYISSIYISFIDIILSFLKRNDCKFNTSNILEKQKNII